MDLSLIPVLIAVAIGTVLLALLSLWRKPKAPSDAARQVTPGHQPRTGRIKTIADLKEFLLEATKDETLARLLVEVTERLGRNGYLVVERGGNGSPYEVEYQEPREDTRRAFGIQAEFSSLRQALALAHSNSERDRIERQIAELVGGFGTIRINVASSDEFNRRKALIFETRVKLKQAMSNTKYKEQRP